MILRLRVVHFLYQGLVSMDCRAGSLTKLLCMFTSDFLLFLSNEPTNDECHTLATAFSWLSLFKILSLHNVYNALSLIAAPAPDSYFSRLLWLLALASRLLRRPSRPAAGARAVSCSGAMCIPPAHGFEIRIAVSPDTFCMMRLRLPHARWGKTPVCHAASYIAMHFDTA